MVLFDEVEKAHPEVRGLLLQILDEGKLTDSAGLTVSFRNTAVVLTANAGEGAGGIGFGGGGADRSRMQAERLLSRELTDRVDEVISFVPLGREALEQVAMNRITRLTCRLRERGITVRVDESFLTLALADTEGSTRSVCRQVAKHAEELLAEGILDGSIKNGCDVVLYGENGDFQMKISSKNLLTNGKKCV